MFIAHINVMPLKELLDPQGKAVESSLKKMSFDAFSNVRIGKEISINIDVSTKAEAEELVEQACKKLLANPVIEYYEYQILEA